MGQGLLERWSRRKRSEGCKRSTKVDCVPVSGDRPPEAALTEADLAQLGSTADFAQFLANGVPEDIRTHALRVLWATDKSLSQGDGLIDYAKDYASEGDSLIDPHQLAFRVGQGLLSDEEAAAWSALGTRAATAAGIAKPCGNGVAATGEVGATSLGEDEGERE